MPLADPGVLGASAATDLLEGLVVVKEQEPEADLGRNDKDQGVQDKPNNLHLSSLPVPYSRFAVLVVAPRDSVRGYRSLRPWARSRTSSTSISPSKNFPIK